MGLLSLATLYTNLFGVSPYWLRLKLFSVIWLFSDNMPCLIGMRVFSLKNIEEEFVCKHKNLYNRSLFI